MLWTWLKRKVDVARGDQTMVQAVNLDSVGGMKSASFIGP